MGDFQGPPRPRGVSAGRAPACPGLRPASLGGEGSVLPRSTERAQPGGLQGGPLRDEKRVTPPPAGPPRVWSSLSCACACVRFSGAVPGDNWWGAGPARGGKRAESDLHGRVGPGFWGPRCLCLSLQTQTGKSEKAFGFRSEKGSRQDRGGASLSLGSHVT